MRNGKMMKGLFSIIMILVLISAFGGMVFADTDYRKDSKLYVQSGLKLFTIMGENTKENAGLSWEDAQSGVVGRGKMIGVKGVNIADKNAKNLVNAAGVVGIGYGGESRGVYGKNPSGFGYGVVGESEEGYGGYFSSSKSTGLGVSNGIQLISGGIKFPDGSVQNTASSGGGSGNSNGWTDVGSVVRLTTSTDKVGIGTTSPITKLHVVGASPSSYALTVTNGGLAVAGNSGS